MDADGTNHEGSSDSSEIRDRRRRHSSSVIPAVAPSRSKVLDADALKTAEESTPDLPPAAASLAAGEAADAHKAGEAGGRASIPVRHCPSPPFSSLVFTAAPGGKEPTLHRPFFRPSTLVSPALPAAGCLGLLSAPPPPVVPFMAAPPEVRSRILHHRELLPLAEDNKNGRPSKLVCWASGGTTVRVWSTLVSGPVLVRSVALCSLVPPPTGSLVATWTGLPSRLGPAKSPFLSVEGPGGGLVSDGSPVKGLGFDGGPFGGLVFDGSPVGAIFHDGGPNPIGCLALDGGLADDGVPSRGSTLFDATVLNPCVAEEALCRVPFPRHRPPDLILLSASDGLDRPPEADVPPDLIPLTPFDGLDLPPDADALDLDLSASTGDNLGIRISPIRQLPSTPRSDAGVPRASLRLSKLEAANALGRAMVRKAKLREGTFQDPGSSTRTFSCSKIKKKATLCGVKLSDREAKDLQAFMSAGV